MSFDAETLYRLLPAIHRLRDAGEGALSAGAQPTPGALRELIEVIADQVAVLEEELEQLYANQFVETAAPWALPYLGDLVGLRGLGGTGQATRFAPRAEVANTIAYRRRKGTAAVLEQLARDVSGNPAAAVEFFRRLATTQHLNHVRLTNVATASLRNAAALEFVGTPFERATRTAEVRRIEPGLGRWNIPNVGLFLWRLRAYRRSRSPLTAAGLPGGRHFRVHPLGLDAPLCAVPQTETDVAHLATPENVPTLLTRRLLAGPPVAGAPKQFHPALTWYGPSLQLWRLDAGQIQPIPADAVVVADLHDVHQDDDPTKPVVAWGHDQAKVVTVGGKLLLDPARGRVVFPTAPLEPVFASVATLFSADLGGGEYARAASFDATSLPRRIVAQQPIGPLPGGAAPSATIGAVLGGVTAPGALIEIRDSGHYREALPPIAANGVELEIRAADGRWPTLTLTSQFQIAGDDNGTVTLNGLLVAGKGISVGGQLGTLRLRHCTVMSGLAISDGRLDSAAPRPVAIEITAPGVEVEFENCILGPLRIGPDVTVRLRNCIVDAGDATAWAIARNADGGAGGTWRIENSTVIGRVSVRGLELASNTIFLGTSVKAERRQEGCVRFCWLPTVAEVPRRHRCLPREEPGLEAIRPQFASLRFGDPGYCQLSPLCPAALRTGADDESELGAFHDLYLAPREAHLRARLREYLPFGLEAGLFHEGNLTERASTD